MRGIALLNIAVGLLLLLAVTANFQVGRVTLAIIAFAVIGIGLLALRLRATIHRNLAATATVTTAAAQAKRYDPQKQLEDLASGAI